jgi:hypothetical protein
MQMRNMYQVSNMLHLLSPSLLHQVSNLKFISLLKTLKFLTIIFLTLLYLLVDFERKLKIYKSTP